MLYGIEAWNFQAHRHTRFLLHPGVNVFQGENCVGKSTILRQIRSVAFFEKMGVSTWAKKRKEECRVTLEFGKLVDGQLVKEGSLSRSRVENEKKELLPGSQTFLFDDGSGPIPLQKLRSTYPDPVLRFINMDPMVFEDGVNFSLNFSEQISPMGPFLIGSGFKGTTRMKLLGSVTEQHLFDEGGRRAKNQGAEAKDEAKTLLKLAAETKATIASIEAEPDYTGVIRDASSRLAKIQRLQQEVAQLQSLLQRAIETKRRTDACRQEIAGLPSKETVRERIGFLQEHHEWVGELSICLQRHSRWTLAVEEAQREREELPDLHRVAERLRRAESLSDRSLALLASRAVSAERERRAVADARAPLALLGRVGERVQALGAASLRASELGTLLRRMQLAGEGHASARASLEASRRDRDGLRLDLQKALDATRLCPYSPFQVELQEACREKLKV